MKHVLLAITVFWVSGGFIPIDIANSIYAQGLTVEQIKTVLLDNPPNTGDSTLREQTILALDEILKADSSRSSQSVFDFYAAMVEKVKSELNEEVSEGASFWMMYNHGYVVKTPEIVFAFDLADGYRGWEQGRRYELPTELVQQIDVLFFSHTHGDHNDESVKQKVRNNGGSVIGPSDEGSFTVSGLHVTVHHGLHSVPNMIFEVTTAGGLKIVHTGDNQTSMALPEIDSLEVLLLNAWVNESGSASAVVGMRNCISRLMPKVMIPGHIQELGHDYVPGQPASRVPYEWAFEVDDIPATAEVQVMAWGERYFVASQPVAVTEQNERLHPPASFVLYQNYPNPFNPTTTIEFSLPKSTFMTLKIYSILGEEVATLVGERLPAGKHQRVWDASGLASGIYVYRIEAGSFAQARKLILLK